jgi:hypothetical protein
MTATVAYCQANTISGHSGTRRDPTSPFHCCQTGVIEAPFLTSSPDVYVCYMESCGLASVPAVALCLGRRRWLLSLHSVDLLNRRDIPIPDIGRLGVDHSATSAEHVCYQGGYGRFRRTEIGRNYRLGPGNFTPSPLQNGSSYF